MTSAIQLEKSNARSGEGGFGNVKQKYGLDLILTKLPETSTSAVVMGYFVVNMNRIARKIMKFLSEFRSTPNTNNEILGKSFQINSARLPCLH